MQNRERLQVQSTSVVDFNSTNMLDVSTITLYHTSLNAAYVSITVSKPLGLSFDAALSSWLFQYSPDGATE